MPAKPSRRPQEPAPALARWRAKPDRAHLLDRARSRVAFAFWFLFGSAEAFAQFSGSASLLSDYRYRGVSLSDGKPAAQAALAYDDASGWYGGAFASTVRVGQPTSRQVQGIAFAGYAKRMPSGLSFEVGGDYSAMTGDHSYSFGEVYAGVASENVSGRLYYAPRYFGIRTRVIYGEINASQQLSDRVRLLAHAGVLRNSSDEAYGQPSDRFVFDANVGIIFDFDQFSAQLSWVGISSVNTPYPSPTPSRKNSAVLVLSWSF